MENQIQIYDYEGQQIEFDLTSKKLMVNATEMAMIYGKKVEAFLRNDNTKKFTEHCLKSENSSFLGIKKITDLVDSKQKSGTWMHRVLALKFAAWLDPAFELWVYKTIDELLFGTYREMEQSLKSSAQRRTQIAQLKTKLLESKEYQKLEQLEQEERQATHKRIRYNRNQLELFMNEFLT